MGPLPARPPGGAFAPQDPQRPPPPPGEAPQDPQEPAQGTDILADPRIAPLLGKPIRTIRVLQVDRGQVQAMTDEAADAILRGLGTRTGQPLEVRKISSDVSQLWYERRLAVRALARPHGEEVDLYLLVEREVQVYERVEFNGLRQFTRSEVEALLGLYADRQVTSTEAIAMRNVLIARYAREGFAFCHVDLDEREPLEGESSGDRPRKIVTFRIDEGPRVTVGEVRFRGNYSFPAHPAMGIFGAGDHLVRDAHIQSGPAGFLASGDPYSSEVLEEDLDRLKLFYRSRGFLDATVNVAHLQFREGREVVDLEFLVVEGPRYRVRGIRIVHVDDRGTPVDPATAFYPVSEIEKVLETKAGDFFDHNRIRRDLLAIEDFYGERGHPSQLFPGMSRVPGAFRIDNQWPKETLVGEAGVHLTFEIVEGTPKVLRDVLIRGNESTRDRVIRRHVFALPGELIDMVDVDKSLRYLEATRFFQDQLTLAGPRFELLQVPGRSDQLDLAIDVTEGETGEFRWGIGISTGAGATATFQFNKRNFDLTRLPSSWNPLTIFDEILDNKAFHGGGQTLNLLAAPGTQVSQFQLGLTEPDIFGDHFDPTELRVNGHRLIRRYSRDGYTSDTLGAELGLARTFGEELRLGVSVRQELVEIDEISPDATELVFDAEGRTELRGLRLTAAHVDLDNLRRPTEGLELRATYEFVGGPLGGEEDLWRATLRSDIHVPLAENELGHRTVLQLDQFFGVAQAFGSSDDVFLTERFWLGGSNLRGFDFRAAGPSQFGRPLGGEATYTSTLQLSMPLVATRFERDVRDRELLRGVLFLDFGLLGLSLDDPSFREPRLSYGFGVRIEVPVLQIPIALDLAWPILYEETDERRQLWFNISY